MSLPSPHSALNRPMVSEPLLIKPGKHTVFGMKIELISTVRAIPLTYTQRPSLTVND